MKVTDGRRKRIFIGVHLRLDDAAVDLAKQMLTVVGFSGSDSATRRRRSGPNQHEFFYRFTNREVLRHEKDARAGIAGLKKVAEMPRHGMEIVRHRNAILRSRQRQHLGIDTPSRSASLADRKSISASRRKHPATIPSLRSASARKRIIRQDRRASSCCRARSSFCFRSGGAGWVPANSSSTRSRSAISVSTSSLEPR